MHLSHTFRNAGRFSAALFLLIVSLAVVPVTSVFAASSTMGEQKTVVILVNFTDNTAQPKTAAELNNLVFGQVSDFFWENSYQKTFVSGDTFGWFTIPASTVQCNWDLVVQEGNRAAVAAGANLSAYTQFVYLYPNASGCVGGGGGTIGPNGEKRVFVNGESGFNVWMIAHEMGHGFGLGHSDALDCDVSPLGNNCVTFGYGDVADTMAGAGHFNAFQKERLGWLNATGAPPITTVTSSGRYLIDRYETTGTTPKALKILKSTDAATGQKTWYYVEYRQPIGFDSVLAGRGNLTSGILVRTGTLGSYSTVSLLLDMTPNSASLAGLDFEDGALAIGRSFVDAVSGVTITLAGADANGATIDVSVGGATPTPTCTRVAPGISLSGPTAAVAAGSTVSYTLSLSNQDSSACAATTFNLARSIPSGWIGALTASSLSLSPGATSSTTLSVTSASNAADGGYGIGVGASSSSGSVHTANASATYTVAAAQSSGTLTGTVGTDKSSYLRGQTVTMSALVRNNGAAVSGANVKFTVTLPGGNTAVLNALSGSDGYARGTFKVGKGKSAIGGYALRADASSNGGTATAATAFSVN